MVLATSIEASGVNTPSTTPSTPIWAKVAMSSSMTDNSGSEYTKSPVLGRTIVFHFGGVV